MPTSITRLSKFTIPIAGLNPQGAGLPTHNMISPVAAERGREKRGKIERRTYTEVRRREVKEKGRKGWRVPLGAERKRLEIWTEKRWLERNSKSLRGGGGMESARRRDTVERHGRLDRREKGEG